MSKRLSAAYRALHPISGEPPIVTSDVEWKHPGSTPAPDIQSHPRLPVSQNRVHLAVQTCSVCLLRPPIVATANYNPHLPNSHRLNWVPWETRSLQSRANCTDGPFVTTPGEIRKLITYELPSARLATFLPDQYRPTARTNNDELLLDRLPVPIPALAK